MTHVQVYVAITLGVPIFNTILDMNLAGKHSRDLCLERILAPYQLNMYSCGIFLIRQAITGWCLSALLGTLPHILAYSACSIFRNMHSGDGI